MSDPDDRLIENAVRLGLAWRFARRARPLPLGDTDGGGSDRLEPGELETLDQIAASGEAPMAELAARRLIDRSTATRAVDRLVAKRLAMRRRSPDDARVQLVSLTPTGQAVHADVVERRTAATVRLLERFDPDDREAIGRLLPMLADAAADAAGISQGPLAEGQEEPTSSDPRAQIAHAVGLAWRFLMRARASIVAAATAEAKGPGLESGDVDTLDEIAGAGGQAQMSDIARGMQVNPPAATRAVSRLVEKGLAVRQRDPADNRILRISLTDLGVNAQAIVRDARLTFAIQLLERFEPEDHEAIDRLMPALADVLADELGLDR